jgi:phage baseplate assembly protein gpV
MSDQLQGIRNIYRRIDQARNEVTHIAEAIVAQVRKKDKKVKLLLLPDLEDIGWTRLYMMNANNSYSSGQIPEIDTTVLVVFPRGDRSTAICLSGGYCQSEAGENGFPLEGDHDVVFSDKYGNKIVLKQGKITIEGSEVVVKSSKAHIDSPSIILGPNGSRPIARVGDQVATPVGPGVIIEGNTGVLA